MTNDHRADPGALPDADGPEIVGAPGTGWGAANEVLPKEKLLDRAWELAREIAKRPPMTLRYTRRLFTQNFKRACLDELSHGIALELFAQRQFYPGGGGMGGLKRSWDDDNPMGD